MEARDLAGEEQTPIPKIENPYPGVDYVATRLGDIGDHLIYFSGIMSLGSVISGGGHLAEKSPISRDEYELAVRSIEEARNHLLQIGIAGDFIENVVRLHD